MAFNKRYPGQRTSHNIAAAFIAEVKREHCDVCGGSGCKRRHENARTAALEAANERKLDAQQFAGDCLSSAGIE